MARPRTDLPDGATLRALADNQGRLALRVCPGARTEAMTITDGQIVVKVRCPPEDGKANAAVVALLARALALPVSRLELIKGAGSRQKLIRIVE